MRPVLHLPRAAQYLAKHGAGHYTFNLGTGKGYSVLDMVKAMLRDRQVPKALIKRTKLYYDFYLYESSDVAT